MWPWNASPWKMRGRGIAANPQNSYHSYRLGFLVGTGAYPFADPRNSKATGPQFDTAMGLQPRLVSFGTPSSPLPSARAAHPD